MADIVIEIEVQDNGNFTYYPAVCHATPEDRINWNAKGNWATQVTGGTPLARTFYSGHAEKVEFTDDNKVREGVKGIFHYAVAVAVPGSPVFPVLLDAGCPTIIID